MRGYVQSQDNNINGWIPLNVHGYIFNFWVKSFQPETSYFCPLASAHAFRKT